MKLGKYEAARLTLLSIDMKGALVLDETFKDTLELKAKEQKRQAAKSGIKANKNNSYAEHKDTTSNVSQVIPTLRSYEMYTDEQVTFLHASVNKLLRNNLEAEALYVSLEEKIKFSMTECLVTDLFGIINLLILNDRRHLEDHLCTLH